MIKKDNPLSENLYIIFLVNEDRMKNRICFFFLNDKTHDSQKGYQYFSHLDINKIY
jgi:hypothetical protein